MISANERGGPEGCLQNIIATINKFLREQTGFGDFNGKIIPLVPAATSLPTGFFLFLCLLGRRPARVLSPSMTEEMWETCILRMYWQSHPYHVSTGKRVLKKKPNLACRISAAMGACHSDGESTCTGCLRGNVGDFMLFLTTASSCCHCGC